MITLNERFTFVCSETDRRLLAALAEHLNRSQGDTIRFLLRKAAQAFQLNLDPRSTGINWIK